MDSMAGSIALPLPESLAALFWKIPPVSNRTILNISTRNE
jgi:hypothetical protein